MNRALERPYHPGICRTSLLALTRGSAHRPARCAAAVVSPHGRRWRRAICISTGIEAKAAWTRTYTVTEGATLEIRETNGRVASRPTDGDEVEVTATRIRKAPTEEAAKAAAEGVQIKEKAVGDRVELDSTAGH